MNKETYTCLMVDNFLIAIQSNFQKHGEFIDIDVPNGGYSNVDPQAVDLKKYPGLANAPWWEAKMEAGDCLFIPVK